MKLRTLLVGGHTIPWIALLILFLLSMGAAKGLLEQQTAQQYKLEAKVVFSDIDNTLLDTISGVKLYTSSTYLQNVLKQSNTLHQNLTSDQIAAIENAYGGSSAESGPIARSNTYQDIRKDLLELFNTYSKTTATEIFVTDASGINIGSSHPTSDLYQADEEWWQEGSQGFRLSDKLEYDESSQTYSIEYAEAIYDDKNNFIGVYKIVFDAGRLLDDAVDNLQLQVQPVVFLFNANNEVIYSSENAVHISQKELTNDFHTLFASGVNHIVRNKVGHHGDEHEYIFTYAASELARVNQYKIGLVGDAHGDIEGAFILLDRLLLTLLAIVIISIVFTIATSLHITRKVSKVELATKTIADGNYDIPLHTAKDIAEFSNLTESVETMRKNTQHLIETLNKTIKELQTETDQVTRLLVQKDEFINQLSHDLRTPLTPMMLVLPELLNYDLDDDARQSVEITIKNVDFLHKLVLDTLSLARLQSGNIKLDCDLVDLRSLISEQLSLEKSIFEEKNVTPVIKIPKNTQVFVDPIKLKEAIQNMASNALQYTGKGGKVSFTVKNSENKDYVDLVIKDTGVGIEREKLPFIFDEFYQADDSRHNLGNSGLGLSIVKRIVELMGGKITVHSAGLGKGTSFVISLPTKKP